MAISPYKTFAPGEILTAADLNASFSHITSGGEDLGWPATKAKDLDGFPLILDSDGDTQLLVTADDIAAFKMQNVNVFFFDGSTSSIVNGLTFTASITAVTPVVSATGSDANISLGLQPKGTGDIEITAGGSETEIALVAAGSEANIDARVTPKGTGKSILDGDVDLNGDTATVTSTDDGATAAPTLDLFRDSASPADDDYIGQVLFAGDDDAGNKTSYAALLAQIRDVTDASEDAEIVFQQMVAGSLTEVARLTSAGFAVRQVVTAQSTTDDTIGATSPTNTSLSGSITLRKSDSKVIIACFGRVRVSHDGVGGSVAARNGDFIIRRTSGTATNIVNVTVGRTKDVNDGADAPSNHSLAIVGEETPGAGTHTYVLRANTNSTAVDVELRGSTGGMALMVMLEVEP